MTARVYAKLRRRLVTGLALLATVTVLLGVTSSVDSAGAATAARPTFGGLAFGTTAQLGSLVHSGRSALVPICTRNTDTGRADNIAGTKIPGVGRVGAVTTSIHTGDLGTGVRVLSTSHTATTSLFGHAVHLDAVSTRAQAARADGVTKLSGGAAFVNLVISGHRVPADPPANSIYEIPGVATVAVNQQARTHADGNPRIAVTALSITVRRGNSLGLPPGRIVVGHSVASLHNPTHRLTWGTAYGTRVSLANRTVRSGRTAPVYMGCGGTGGQWMRNATAAVHVPHVLRGAAVASRARSHETGGATVAHTDNRVAHVDLFDGIIRARAVVTDATATRRPGSLARSSAGTTFLGLRINGQGQSATAPQNTKINLPGVGTLWLNRVLPSKDGLQAYGLQLVLGRKRQGLPVGATITVGSAAASVSPR